jgi:hypothetical protein
MIEFNIPRDINAIDQYGRKYFRWPIPFGADGVDSVDTSIITPIIDTKAEFADKVVRLFWKTDWTKQTITLPEYIKNPVLPKLIYDLVKANCDMIIDPKFAKDTAKGLGFSIYLVVSTIPEWFVVLNELFEIYGEDSDEDGISSETLYLLNTFKYKLGSQCLYVYTVIDNPHGGAFAKGDLTVKECPNWVTKNSAGEIVKTPDDGMFPRPSNGVTIPKTFRSTLFDISKEMDRVEKRNKSIGNKKD